MPGFSPFRRRHRHDRHDFEREQVVHGYDPVLDGFAYPHTVEAPDLNPSCSCTIIPSKPHGECEPIIEFCGFCLSRLTLT